MTLRIIAGIWGGRRLAAPPGDGTRPIPDRIKQSFFDSLGGAIVGTVIADCCAGSGSVGFEALSRGAQEVHAIESSTSALTVLRQNRRTLGDPAGHIIHGRPFEDVLPGLRGLDIVFADPPFPWFRDQPGRIVALVTVALAALGPHGRLFIRGERGSDLPALPGGCQPVDRRTYGRSWIDLLIPPRPP